MTGAASWLPNYTHELVSPLSDLGKTVRASILTTDDHPNIAAGMVVWCEFLAKKKLGSEDISHQNCQYIKMHLKVTSGKHIK